MVIRLFNSEEFKESQSITIDQKEVELLEEKFRSEFSTQPTTTETQSSNTPLIVPKFTQEHIHSLNEQFSKIQSQFVGKEDFKKIVSEVLFGTIEGKELLQVLNLDKLYDSFDTNKNEGLSYQ